MEDVILYKDDIQERMELLDKHVDAEYDGDGRFQVVIVGGGALVLRGYIVRSTDDIDIIEADNRLLSLMLLYDMNGRINSWIQDFPYNYADRIVPVWSGKKIDYYTASLEDIALAKICADREKDQDDLAAIAPLVDWDILDKLVEDKYEMNFFMSDRAYKDFLFCYGVFERRYRPCKD